MSAARREALLRAFAAYRAADSREDEAASRFGRFLARADPFRRNDPDGQNFEFLLVFHRKLDRWLQPGGHVEDGDASVFHTALREVREETGLSALTAPIGDAILDLDIHAIPEFGAEPAHVHYDVRFLVTTRDGGVLPSGAAWFDFADVAPVDRDGSLARGVAKARARLP
jgi:8-oxo-dGTP pyrophosphatase MutT (NUDIX family)